MNIFRPKFNTLASIGIYLLLFLLLAVILWQAAFFITGFIVCTALMTIHIYKFAGNNTLTKKHHLAYLSVTTAMLFILLLESGLEIKRSGLGLLLISLASLPPFYHFCGLARYTQADEKNHLLKYVSGIMLVPFMAFLIYNYYQGANYKTIYLIVIGGAYYFVLFAVIKITAILLKGKNSGAALRKNPRTKKYITIFLGLFMPVTGLILNQYMYSASSAYAQQKGYGYLRVNQGFFGDFSHPVFYVLTILNGLLLLLPIEKHKPLQLPLFYFRAVGYSFIIYMFIVFLPVLPVGVLTLVFIVGIYAFVPLLLTLWQGRILKADRIALKQFYPKKLLSALFVLGFLTLPAVLSVFFAYDRANYQKALTYLQPYYTAGDTRVDAAALKRTLDVRYMGTYKSRLYGSPVKAYFSYKNVPLISGAYKYYIYRGEQLDYKARNKLGALFFDERYFYNSIPGNTPDILDYYTQHNLDVVISDISQSTRFDEEIQAYRTWVDLELYNAISRYNEFTTTFQLPDGVYVSDYYLYVGEEKKMGMLMDQRAALSVYKSIVLQQLDPGILYYKSGNQLELRVFPFYPGEVRQTGIEFIHVNGFQLNLGTHEINIDVDKNFIKLETENAVLLSPAEIAALPPLHRQYDYYFVLDSSENSNTGRLTARIRRYCQQNGIEEGTLYLSTYTFEKHPLKDMDHLDIKKAGGFNLNLAVKDIIRNADSKSIPIIIFVSEKEDYGIIYPEGIHSYLAPESQYYYRLNFNESLTPHSFSTNYRFDDVRSPIICETVSYHGIPVINDGQDKIIVLKDTIPDTSQNQYLNAFHLAVENKIHLQNGVKSPLSYIRKSFLSHVLTPATAFIVVETEEQEQALLERQEQILNQQEQQESTSLSEPSFLILITLLAICIILFKTTPLFCPPIR